MLKLTPRQAEILAFIKRCLEDNGFPPTRAEIAQELGFKSPNAAEEHLKALARKGAIEMTPGASRGIRIPGLEAKTEESGLPIIGRVAAGAPILAELLGYGMTADAADMVNPSIDGASTAMQMALDDASLAASDIDYVNAHGTATAVNDINETRAIKRVFGANANKLSISSTKSMHGHCLGAGGGIEAVAAVKAIEEKFVPATVGLDEVDPECDLDYTPNVGRKREVNYAMSNSFAFGGLNAVLVFGPPPA